MSGLHCFFECDAFNLFLKVLECLRRVNLIEPESIPQGSIDLFEVFPRLSVVLG